MDGGDADDPDRLLDDIDELFELINEVTPRPSTAPIEKRILDGDVSMGAPS